MTTKVFIAGSITIKNLDPKVKERIANIVDQGFEVLVGDADGVDSSVQNYLSELNAKAVTVFCSGEVPRNNSGSWSVEPVSTLHKEGSRAFFTAKDVKMAETADFGLMIWDTKSTGTLSNVIELLSAKKKSVVFVNKDKIFKNVSSIEHLEDLIGLMSDHAKKKAEDKIRLSEKVSSLKNEQLNMF
ncbi:hypothetical protein CLU84_1655 [Comamonas sp. 26]|nr:hypothetical protein CLU84_1655 [Comamonas sp. 26]